MKKIEILFEMCTILILQLFLLIKKFIMYIITNEYLFNERKDDTDGRNKN